MKQKKVYLEILRIIACFLVIFNHLSGYTLFMVSSGVKQQIYMSIAMLTKVNVPLFFMIAGALLLSKEEDISTVLRKRVSRISVTLIIFSFGLYIIYIIKNMMLYQNNLFRCSDFFRLLLSNSIEGSGLYWFLYAYLAFLLVLPFLQRAVKNMKKEDFYLLLIVHFILVSVLPIINIILLGFNQEILIITGSFDMPLAILRHIFYPIIGYYLDSSINVFKINKKYVIVGTIIVILGVVVSCICTTYQGIITDTYTQNYVLLFDYISAIYVFIMVKYISIVKIPNFFKGKIQEGIILVGSLTFGIYLLDPYLKIIFGKNLINYAIQLMPTIIVSFAWCIISMILGGIITWSLKKINFMNKYL